MAGVGRLCRRSGGAIAGQHAGGISVSTSRHLTCWIAALAGAYARGAGFCPVGPERRAGPDCRLWYLCPDFCEPDIFLLQQLAVHGWSLALGVPLVLALLSRAALQAMGICLKEKN